MAGLASRRLSILADLLHALFELAVMDVLVTGCARQMVEKIRNLRLRLILICELVAIRAGHRDVAARQFELGLLVLRQRKRGRTVTLQVVALIALILVGLCRELVVVLVHVAIGAALEIRDLEHRVLALWSVALVALQLSVSIDERVVRFGVSLHIEQ